jgi:hypothetical protein
MYEAYNTSLLIAFYVSALLSYHSLAPEVAPVLLWVRRRVVVS